MYPNLQKPRQKVAELDLKPGGTVPGPVLLPTTLFHWFSIFIINFKMKQRIHNYNYRSKDQCYTP